jgi:hypothetical protein
LQCYQVQTGEWKEKSAEKTFSARGWNQLIAFGQTDNTLETAFSRVETDMPGVFAALENAANVPSMRLPRAIFENLCWYCTFLHGTSPFAKAKAAVDFAMQMDSELQKGECDLLRDVLNVAEDTINRCRKAHSVGRRIIIDSEDHLQLVYRLQFQRSYQNDFSMFRHSARWSICNSPIELPISDMALICIPENNHTAVYFILPIGPQLLLKGIIKCGPQQPSSQITIESENLTTGAAEDWLDVICLSAVTELVCCRKIYDVSALRSRAEARGVKFHRIANPELVFGAGLTNPNSYFGLREVSEQEWVSFVHDHVLPPSPDSGIHSGRG